jgi:hypothetical protein
MLASNHGRLPVRAEVTSAGGLAALSTPGHADVRLRRERGPGLTGASWKAVITVYVMTPLDPEQVLAEAHDFYVDDPEGPVGIVDEVRVGERKSEGTILVACGWFGRHRLALRFEDVEEIVPDEGRLILRPRLPAIVEVRRRERRGATRISAIVRGLLGGRTLPGRGTTRRRTAA